MIDGAPLIAAAELGLFRKHGVEVRLSREVGWASVRDRLVHQEIVGAHAPATMAFTLCCGLGSLAVKCLTACVLSYGGSAVTVSSELVAGGVTDPASLATHIAGKRLSRPLRFAAVYEYSTQLANLKAWLASGGIAPGRDVEIVMIPSPQVHRSLASGHIDGFCVAEPWSAAAEAEQSGRIILNAASRGAEQVEKVFVVLERFERQFPDEHLAMIAAVQEAAVFCAEPSCRKDLVRMLARPDYLDVSTQVLARSLAPEKGVVPVGGVAFGAGEAGAPTRERGRAVYDLLESIGVPAECRGFRKDIITKIFREDLYRKALTRPPFPCPAGAEGTAPASQMPSVLHGARAA